MHVESVVSQAWRLKNHITYEDFGFSRDSGRAWRLKNHINYEDLRFSKVSGRAWNINYKDFWLLQGLGESLEAEKTCKLLGF